MTEIGLGLAALGRPGYINLGHGGDVADASVAGMERAAHAVLDAAYEGGVRASTPPARTAAPRSSSRLAGASRARPDDVVVSSKWGYSYTAGWRVDAERARGQGAHASTSCAASGAETRELLGDHLSIYQIHSATLESGVLDDAAVRAELDGAARGGRPRRPHGHRRAADGDDRARARRSAASTPSRRPGTCTSAPPSRRLPGARRRPARLRQGGARQRPAHRARRQRGARRRGARAGHDRGRARARRRARAPWAGVVLSGAATVEQLESNLAARDVAWDENAERQLSGLEEDPDEYWAARAELPWN